MGLEEREEAVPEYLPAMVDVDVRGLEDFAALLRAELEANLRPGRERIAADHGQGVGFGARNPSGDIQAARAKYFNCLNRALENLAAYVDASEVLIAAAGKIAAHYRGVDALSAARQREVEEALTQAVIEAQRAQTEAVEAIRQTQWQHKMGRFEHEDLG